MAKAKYIFRNYRVDAFIPSYEYLIIDESGNVLSVHSWTPDFAKEIVVGQGLEPISAMKWLTLKNGP